MCLEKYGKNILSFSKWESEGIRKCFSVKTRYGIKSLNDVPSFRAPTKSEDKRGLYRNPIRLEQGASGVVLTNSFCNIINDTAVLLTIMNQIAQLEINESALKRDIYETFHELKSNTQHRSGPWFSIREEVHNHGTWYFTLLSLKIAHPKVWNLLEDGKKIAQSLESVFVDTIYRPCHFDSSSRFVYSTLKQVYMDFSKKRPLPTMFEKFPMMPRLSPRRSGPALLYISKEAMNKSRAFGFIETKLNDTLKYFDFPESMHAEITINFLCNNVMKMELDDLQKWVNIYEARIEANKKKYRENLAKSQKRRKREEEEEWKP